MKPERQVPTVDVFHKGIPADPASTPASPGQPPAADAVEKGMKHTPNNSSTPSTTNHSGGLHDTSEPAVEEGASTPLVEAVEANPGGGGEPVSTPGLERWRNGDIVPSIQLKAMMAAIDVESERYWGPFLYRGSLVMLVAEASTGKTVFVKRLTRKLALGESFLGYPPPRPLRILIVELESPDLVLKEQFDAITPVEGLDYVRCDGPKLKTLLNRHARDYDVIVLDPLMMGLPADDENDNSEANRQLVVFKKLASRHGTSFIVTHNTGVGETSSGRGRGASARRDRVDVEWLYMQNARTGGGRRLTITKDRNGAKGTVLDLEFDGDLDFQLIRQVLPRFTKADAMLARVLEAPWTGEQSRGALAEHLGIVRDSVEDRHLTNALTTGLRRGRLVQGAERGLYRRKEA